jgi:hypothetical protein
MIELLEGLYVETAITNESFLLKIICVILEDEG